MKPTSTETNLRIRSAAEQVFGPVRAPRGSLRRRILLARSFFAYATVVSTLVQLVVWLVIGVFTGHLDTPWWLWTTVPATAVVVGLTLADRWHTWWATASATPPTH
jgi:hypothetical protein